jgi:hypothetical protein
MPVEELYIMIGSGLAKRALCASFAAAIALASNGALARNLFVQSEGPDVVGQGAQYRGDAASGFNFNVRPVLEAFDMILPDNTIRLTATAPGQTWSMAFANRDVSTLRVGSERLGCSVGPSDQCVAYYAVGIVPNNNPRSLAAASIRLNGRSCEGSTTFPQRTNFGVGNELVRFNVPDALYATMPRPIGGDIQPEASAFSFTRPDLTTTFLPVPPDPRRNESPTNALFTTGEIGDFIVNWGFDFRELVTAARSLTTTYDTGDAATALTVTYTYTWRIITRRNVTDVGSISIDFEQACAVSGDFGRLFGALRYFGGASNPYIYGDSKIRGYSIPQLGSGSGFAPLATVLPDNTSLSNASFQQENFRRRYPAHTRDYLLYFESGDSTLGVGPTTLTTSDMDFTAEPLYGDVLKGVRIIGRGPGNNIVMDFGAGYDQPIHTNCRNRICFRYTNLQRRVSKDDITAGMDITVNGRRCNTIAGSMSVREAFFNGNRVDAFAADFDISCNGGPTFHGEVRFNSDIAVGDYDEDGIPDSQETSSNRARNEPDNYLLAINGVDGTSLFVRQQYRDFYASEPSLSAFTRDQLEIDLGARTRSDFLLQQFNNPTFNSIYGPVARLYLASFGRLSDSTGLNYWSNRYKSIRRPISLTGIADLYITSPEFRARFPALVDPAANRQFVQQLYVNVLGRGPDQVGEDFWTTQLANGAITRAALVTQFSESPEHQARTLDAINVNLAYFAMLRRDPFASEYAGYTDLLSGRRLLPNGQRLTVSGMLDHIARSEEYCERFTEIQYCRSVTAP